MKKIEMTAQDRTAVPMTKAEAGRLGGLKTAANAGSHGMSALGYGGMLTTAERHHNGDVEAMMAELRTRRQAKAVYDERNMCWVRPAAKLN